MSLTAIRRELKTVSNNEKAVFYQKFFKTGPGEYGHGDQFIDVTVPALRTISKTHQNLTRSSIKILLNSPIHEERMLGLFILVLQYQRGDDIARQHTFDFYVKHKNRVNNWDLVDTTCHKIIGAHLYSRNRDLLFELARSPQLWDRRIAMMSTYYFIKREDFDDALKIAEILRLDDHDLIHKVVGWMLREIGKIDQPTEEKFLKKYYKSMPRTMLRYAIEKFPEVRRKAYLNGQV